MLRKVGLISVFARHPNAANLLMALLIIIGIYSLGMLNRQVMPHVGLDAVSASFVWPGASAEDVESNILKAVEPEIRFIDGVKRVNGTAFEGRGSFFIEFQEGTDMSRAFSDVENGISRVTTLPEDMERPVITQTIFYETVSRVALSGPFPESALKAIAKDMRDDLLDRGADKVRIEGLRDDEIWVEVSPATLRRLDLTLGEVSEKIANVSVDRPSGTLEGGYERQIRSLGLRRTVESMGNIEVRSRQDGEKIYLDEIATIRDTFDDDQPYGYFQGN
ncbi:MAG: efflux RND transporter permease subunit, partial [Alphaproteobacteria bacterium]|nr:efflux RND transporter permease subunit [Alphaproteobacteria bacterium]